MNSDSSQPLQAGQPNLPPVAPLRHSVPNQAIHEPVPSPVPAAVPHVASEELAARAAAEARKIVQTYQSDPYTQSQALQQLKTQYLRDRYHINADMAGQ